MQTRKKMALGSPCVWRASGWMCCSALQVDLVGSEKLNNSMGFSMFFVGLGCLTGPPLAGEWITSWKTFRSQTCANPLFRMHTITNAYICTPCAWDRSHDITVLKWFVTRGVKCIHLFLCVLVCVCARACVCVCFLSVHKSFKQGVIEWEDQWRGWLAFILYYAHIFFRGCTYFHGALNSLQYLQVCVCLSVCMQSLWSVKTETHRRKTTYS